MKVAKLNLSTLKSVPKNIKKKLKIQYLSQFFSLQSGLGDDKPKDIGEQMMEGADDEDDNKRRVNPKFQRIKSADHMDARFLFSLK